MTTPDTVIIETPAGRMRGRVASGVQQFLGVRYGEPPTGPRRFSRPVAARGWSGTYDATQVGPRAVQSPAPELLGGSGPGEVSEDCLFLNVFTPAADDRARPVICWIHGGAFTMGSGNDFDASVLAQQGDVVVVTLSYRLGLLGFLDLAPLGPEHAGSASNGIRDQILALGWIRHHIASFGGDPGNVTIAGVSAGAGSVLAILTAPSADGLYHRAVALCPAGFNAPPDDMLGRIDPLILGSAPLLDRLHAASIDELLQAQQLSGLLFGSIDGTVVPQHPTDAVATRPGNTVPLLIGTNRDDSTLFAAMMRELPGAFESTMLAIAPQVMRGDDPTAYLGSLAAALGTSDQTVVTHAVWNDLFRRTAVETALAATQRGARAHLYRFDLATTVLDGSLGATHGAEIALTFNWFAADEEVGVIFHERTDDVRRLAATWSEMITTFARTGVPAAAGLPPWPPYDAPDRLCLVFDDRPRVDSDPDHDRRGLWTTAADSVVG